MENLDINVYLGKEDGDTLPAEEWNGALGTVQNKVNELVSDSNTAVDYNKLDSSLKSSIDKANNAVLTSMLASNYYSKTDTGILGPASLYDQKIDFSTLGEQFTWNDINELLDAIIENTFPEFNRKYFRKKFILSGPSYIDIISYLYRKDSSTNTWCQTVEGAISIDGNGQLTAGSKYTKYTRTYTDGDANPSAWEEVGGSGSVEGAVLYDQAQSLTDGQKALARSNIGAILNIDPNDDILGKIDAQYQTISPTQDDFGDATEGRIVYTLKSTQSDNTIDHVYFGFPTKRLEDSNGNYHNLYNAGDARGVIDFDTPADESLGDFFINLNGTLAPIIEQNDGTISNAIYECIQYDRPVSEFEFRPLPIGSVSTIAGGVKQGNMYTLTKRGWVSSLSEQLDGVESVGMMVLIA